ncbi:MAG TPA: FABP family protein [Actinomycetota bacterium]|nr:FABP family protein [Actinomycetota bacterium]
MTEPPLHPDCAALEPLLGTWRGEGRGEYPTISPFRYREEARFWHAGKPFLVYLQRTWALEEGSSEDGSPLHTETGYWRPKPDGRIEVVLAHALGIAEIEEGTVAVSPDGGLRIGLKTTAIGSTSTAKDIRALARTFTLGGDGLSYSLSMEAVGQPLRGHLEAKLRRVAADERD